MQGTQMTGAMYDGLVQVWIDVTDAGGSHLESRWVTPATAAAQHGAPRAAQTGTPLAAQHVTHAA